MNDWSLVSEYFALILIAIIALFLCGSKPVRGFKTRRYCYIASLAMSAVSILLNIVTVDVIEHIDRFSVPLALALNTLYFFSSWIMITVMVYYVFLRILEFVYNKRYLHGVRIILASIFLCFCALLVYNLFSGVIFCFDDNMIYRRGPLNFVGYILPLIEVLLLLVCFFIHRKNISVATRRVLFVGSPIAIVLILYQTIYPEQLLNGALAAIVNLIIFISYYSSGEAKDFITGLDNRHCFTAELMHRTLGRQSYQVILIRLRCLAEINRKYGQEGGDALLFKIGEAASRLAIGGMAFRHADEEFVLLYPDSDDETCERRLKTVANSMRKKWQIGIFETDITFSAVEFRYRGQPWSFDDITSFLSISTHTAMADGIEELPFNIQSFCRHERREYIIRSLRSAMQENRFRVLYQPIYYHHSGKFESCEALIRMTDSEDNLISPNEFIPIAEETGLVDLMVEFVLDKVCSLLGSGKIGEIKAISINLPIKQVIEEKLDERFDKILQRYRIKPGQIKIEITERDIEENGDAVLDAIKHLSKLGYRFMLDDFGIGYSNLSRALSLPFESIKLDHSLVLLLEENSKQHEIIKQHIVPMFHNIGQSVVAEGVETAEMAETVLGCNVDRIQGFYYARPMDEKELIEWYETRTIQNNLRDS